jgi:Tol biopolymer transport system component
LVIAGVMLAGLLWGPLAPAAGTTPGEPISYNPSLSADGRFVAFESLASNLVDGDTNDNTDVFVRDTRTGTTTRISVRNSGEQFHGYDYGPGPVINADGTHVLFPEESGLYDRDLAAGTSVQVTGSSYSGYGLSADGRYVVFTSTDSNIVSGDTNGADDVFVRNMVAGTTTRVSLSDADAEIRGGGYDASISGDGRFVAFTSPSPELVGGSNRPARVLVRDLRAGTTEPVSIGRGGAAPNGDSTEPAISSDGRFVTFSSFATNLVAGSDTNEAQDIFVRDREAGTTRLVSAAAGGAPATGYSEASQISADGRSVAFLSTATDLPGATGDGTWPSLYLRHLGTGTTQRVNVANSGTPVKLFRNPSFSLAAGGSLVGFASKAPNVVAGDINGATDVFVRDTSAPSSVLVSVATGGGQGRNCFWSPTDAVIGLPRYRASAGAVSANLTGNPPKILTRDGLGAGTGAPGDRFGAAVAAVYSSGNTDPDNGPGCADLIIGAPGAGPDHAGRVFIAFNSVFGIGAGAPTITVAPRSGVAGDGFGAAVRLITTHADEHESVWRLFVGQPGRDVRGIKNAGAVERFDITYHRDTDQVRVIRREPLTQDSPGVPGTAEAGDRFGEVLSTTSNALGVLDRAHRALLVGVPHEDIGRKRNAGLVVRIPLDPGAKAINVSQDSPGIPGTAETGDHFGAALSGSFCDTLVGVPGEDVGSIRDAGMAQWFSVPPCYVKKDLVAGPSLTQDSPGVPGAAEAGDRFGAAVLAGYGGEYGLSTVIGAPGEDIGTQTDAGCLVYFDPEQPKKSSGSVYQGHGTSGSPEAGDQLGATLAKTVQYDGDNNFAGILIGVPGEDIRTVVDAGVVVHDGLKGSDADQPTLNRTIQVPGGPITNLRYGAVIADSHY